MSTALTVFYKISMLQMHAILLFLNNKSRAFFAFPVIFLNILIDSQIIIYLLDLLKKIIWRKGRKKIWMVVAQIFYKMCKKKCINELTNWVDFSFFFFCLHIELPWYLTKY